jgi:excisionase family DNA binding protein
MEKEFLSIKEVAEYLGVKPCTVYAWAEARMLPHYKFGRFVRFKKSEIDLWIKENKREGNQLINRSRSGIMIPTGNRTKSRASEGRFPDGTV